MEARINRCGDARGDVGCVVRVGLIENITLRQKLRGGEGLSHEWRRVFSAKGIANDEVYSVEGCPTAQGTAAARALELSNGGHG